MSMEAYSFGNEKLFIYNICDSCNQEHTLIVDYYNSEDKNLCVECERNKKINEIIGE